MTFSGKHVWLVGASEGIGAALATALARAGATVAVSARSESKLNALVGGLPARGHVALPLDVTDNASMEAAWQTLSARWPQIDTVIYNAGTYEPMDAQHFNLAQVERMVDVNLRGMMRMLACVLPYFVKQNSGHIVLVGSVAGYRGLPTAIGYGASKAAVIHLAENLKADLAVAPIKVQVINPGFVDTRLTQKNDFHMPAMITPEKAAQAIMKGLQSNCFEIHFPKRFTLLLKCVARLPAPLYFWLIRRLKF